MPDGVGVEGANRLTDRCEGAALAAQKIELKGPSEEIDDGADQHPVQRPDQIGEDMGDLRDRPIGVGDPGLDVGVEGVVRVGRCST